jgi:subfamily B ATP-binding cassette protein MsbA
MEAAEVTRQTNRDTRQTYLRLLGYLRPHWRIFLLAALGMAATAATEPAFPAIMKYLLDNGFNAADAKMVWLIPLGIVALFLVRSLLVFSTGYLMMWISSRLVTDLRRELFAKLLMLPASHFEENSAGKIISRLVYDVSNVTDAATNALISTVRETLTAAALLAYLLYLDWKLTLITLTVAPLIAVTVSLFSKRMRAASKLSLTSMRLIAHTIEETVAAQKVVKIFGGQARQTARFFGASEQFRRAQMREAIPASAITPITHIAASMAIAVIAFLALSQSTGQAGSSAGGFISFITAMLLLIAPIKQLTAVSTSVQRGLAAAQSIFGLLDTPNEPDTGDIELGRVRGDVEFRNVCFQYPGTQKPALENISFTVNAGQSLALVGASGGGKSTLAALIPRFYPLGSGTILIDGQDISSVSLTNLRQNIALVSQDVVLFNDTIAANIAYGVLAEQTIAEVKVAAKAAHALEFIEALPEGFNTLVGENGAKLSGGQRQRIAIARAILKNAPILILDEATSALDTESERQVQGALAELMKGRTTIVIAHRLSTIEGADHILVLHGGRIVETGTHAQLLGRAGHYANLSRLQP